MTYIEVRVKTQQGKLPHWLSAFHTGVLVLVVQSTPLQFQLPAKEPWKRSKGWSKNWKPCQ